MVLPTFEIIHILFWLRVGCVFQKAVMMSGNNLDNLIPVPYALDSKSYLFILVSYHGCNQINISFKAWHLNQDSQQNSRCGKAQMQQQAVKSGERMKGNTRLIGIRILCGCLEKSSIC